MRNLGRNVSHQLSALETAMTDLNQSLETENFATTPGMIQVYEELYRDMLAEAWRILPEYETNQHKIHTRSLAIKTYLKGRRRLEELKKECASVDANVSPAPPTTTPDDFPAAVLSQVRATMESYHIKPSASNILQLLKFYAQVHKMVTCESDPKLSRSERVQRLVEEMETNIENARVGNDASSMAQSFFTDELLVLVAMSKLDKDTLALVTKYQDRTVTPTWAEFRAELLRLTNYDSSETEELLQNVKIEMMNESPVQIKKESIGTLNIRKKKYGNKKR